MHGKFIQISTVVTEAGIVLYALDEKGVVFEKHLAIKHSAWVPIR